MQEVPLFISIRRLPAKTLSLPPHCGLAQRHVAQQRRLQRQLLVAFAQYEQLEQRLQPELQLGQRGLEQQQPLQRAKRPPRALALTA